LIIFTVIMLIMLEDSEGDDGNSWT
jgi:hypothetical protein